jgi:hypothetical protein
MDTSSRWAAERLAERGIDAREVLGPGLPTGDERGPPPHGPHGQARRALREKCVMTGCLPRGPERLCGLRTYEKTPG